MATKHHIITFGEVMMRLSPRGHQRLGQASAFDVTYGGGEANVAASLSHMGLRTTHVTCFPDNHLGKSAAGFLRYHGVDTEYIVYRGHRLGVYYLENGASIRSSQIIYDRSYSAFAQLQPEWFDWPRILEGAHWFHWSGITPAISPSAARCCLEAIQVARQLGVKVSGDVNYRSNLWQYGQRPQDVLPALVEQSDLIVCGESDAQVIFELPLSKKKDSFRTMAETLKERYPHLQYITTTRRQSISASHQQLAALLWSDGALYQTEQLEVNPVIDRIGAGDAYIAGLLYGLMAYPHLPQALEYALSATALKHTIWGDVNTAEEPDVERIRAGDRSGSLWR